MNLYTINEYIYDDLSITNLRYRLIIHCIYVKKNAIQFKNFIHYQNKKNMSKS